MTTATLSTFFATLALFCLAAALALGTIAVLARTGVAAADSAMAVVGSGALWLAALVAGVCTAGSLYYSLGADFLPCELCWYQRICMYPLTVILVAAAIRRDTRAWIYVVPLAGVGTVIAAYHTQLQAFPEQQTFCAIDNPCTTRYVWEFGFVSLPLMSLAGFVFVLALAGVWTAQQRRSEKT